MYIYIYIDIYSYPFGSPPTLFLILVILDIANPRDPDGLRGGIDQGSTRSTGGRMWFINTNVNGSTMGLDIARLLIFSMIFQNIFLHEIWNKLVPEFTKAIGIPLQGRPGGRQNRSKGGPGEVQIGPRGALQRFQKTGHQTNTLPHEKIQLILTKWGPKSRDFWYF